MQDALRYKDKSLTGETFLTVIAIETPTNIILRAFQFKKTSNRDMRFDVLNKFLIIFRNQLIYKL